MPLLTAEQFLAFIAEPANHGRLFELIRGNVSECPPPTDTQIIVCANVAQVVGDYELKRSYGYVTTNDSGVVLERDPDTVRAPDVALYEGDQSFGESSPAFDEVPPVLVVEVLTPADSALAVAHKVVDYLRCGVRIVWLIDPQQRCVAVLRPDAAQNLTESDSLVGGEELPGFRVAVRGLFRAPKTS